MPSTAHQAPFGRESSMFFSRRASFRRADRQRRRGVTSTEYAVLLALMLGTAMTSINCLGRTTHRAFERSGDALPHAASGGR